MDHINRRTQYENPVLQARRLRGKFSSCYTIFEAMRRDEKISNSVPITNSNLTYSINRSEV